MNLTELRSMLLVWRSLEIGRLAPDKSAVGYTIVLVAMGPGRGVLFTSAHVRWPSSAIFVRRFSSLIFVFRPSSVDFCSSPVLRFSFFVLSS